uniref:2,4-dienoyl-CoA reductase [(3E)-enoyl-CoA-producing] n=1 Tax=Helianthus annuus TaxID=4232 RepID=A0A251V893_HELAN
MWFGWLVNYSDFFASTFSFDSNTTMESPFKPDILKGKVALLTGGASGIGFEISTHFGKHGASIAVMGRRKTVVDSAVSSLQSLGIPAVGFAGDVRKQEDAKRVIESTVKHFGKLDILVNAAAGNFLVSPEDLSPNGFRTVMDIDSVGTFTMCHEALNYLKKGGPGRSSDDSGGMILNISATLHYTASWYQIHVAAAKWMLLQEIWHWNGERITIYASTGLHPDR